MPTYEFSARDDSGRIIKGNIVAESIQAGKVKLRNLGYFVSSFIEKKVVAQATSKRKTDAREFKINRIRKVKLVSVINFCQQLSDLLSAGISILECFNALSLQISDENMRYVVSLVKRDIEGGSSIGDAIAKYPKVFPQIVSSLIQAGEVGGFLVPALQRITVTLEKQEELRHKIKSAVVYPIVVLAVAVIVVTFLLIFVVPIFSQVYGDLGGKLPLPTRILLSLSDLVTQKWYVIILFISGIFTGFKIFKKSTFGNNFIDRLKLKLPVVKVLVKKSIVARFTRTLGTLLTSGVPINHALEVTRKIITNIVLLEIINKIMYNIQQGQRVVVAIENTPVFPPGIVQMIRVGEEAGNLDIMLNRAAEIMEREVDTTVKRLTTLIEPLLTVTLGVVVGFIAVSIYLPIFSMSKVILNK